VGTDHYLTTLLFFFAATNTPFLNGPIDKIFLIFNFLIGWYNQKKVLIRPSP